MRTCRNIWAEGGEGGVELAEAVVAPASSRSNFKFLYPDERLDQGKDRDDRDARSTARAAWTTRPKPSAKIEAFTRLGFGELPICMAKTHLSLSHDPDAEGRADRLHAADPRRASVASAPASSTRLCGDMRTMPGLSKRPAFENVDIVDGRVVGLF